LIDGPGTGEVLTRRHFSGTEGTEAWLIPMGWEHAVGRGRASTDEADQGPLRDG